MQIVSSLSYRLLRYLAWLMAGAATFKVISKLVFTISPEKWFYFFNIFPSGSYSQFTACVGLAIDGKKISTIAKIPPRIESVRKANLSLFGFWFSFGHW